MHKYNKDVEDKLANKDVITNLEYEIVANPFQLIKSSNDNDNNNELTFEDAIEYSSINLQINMQEGNNLEPNNNREFIPLKRINSDGFIQYYDNDNTFNQTHKAVDLLQLIEDNDSQYAMQKELQNDLEYTDRTGNMDDGFENDQ